MTAPALDCYVAASLARWRQMDGSARPVIDHPGLYGFVGAKAQSRVRLLITDDRALEPLTGLRIADKSGNLTVFDGAAQCAELLAADSRWQASSTTAMACCDLRTVPRFPLPRELTVWPIRRTGDDPAHGVALTDAVDAVLLADPGEEPVALASFLRSLLGDVRLYAAIDRCGVVRATAGWQLTDTDARVILVDTDPAWRGRGIATAMTAVTLGHAQTCGALTATLDSTTAARSVYLRLRFETVSEQQRFRRTQ